MRYTGLPILLWAVSAVAPFLKADDNGSRRDQPFTPAQIQRLEADRKTVVERWRAVEGHLEQLPQKQRDHLSRLLPLSQAANLSERRFPSAADVRRVAVVFYQAKQGLEAAPLVQFRDALDRYYERLTAYAETSADSAADAARRTAQIEDLLSEPAPRDTAAIGEELAALEAGGQAAEFVDRIRSRFQHPNFQMEITCDAIHTALENLNTTIEHTEYISTSLMGGLVSGTVHLNAEVAASLLPNAEIAKLHLRLSGSMDAPENVLVRNPVIVRSSSVTAIDGEKEITWAGDNFTAEPSSVKATTDMAVHRIEPIQRRCRAGRRKGLRHRLICRIAWNRVNEQKAASERNVEQETKSRVAERFNAFVDEKVQQWNEEVEDTLIRPFMRVGLSPHLVARTTDETLQIGVRQTGRRGLAAPQPPDWQPLNGVMALTAHESALANILHRRAAGAVWTDRQMAEIQKQLLGENTYEFRIGLHPRWQLVLHEQDPLATRFSKEGVQFQLSASELTIEGRRFPYPFRIEALYMPQRSTTVPWLQRIGDVKLIWLGPQPSDAETRTKLEEFLKVKFSDFFYDEAYADALVAPAGGRWSIVSDLKVTSIHLKPGWLRIIYGESSPVTAE